ncbi:MAG: hypothetical protein JRI36_04405 [Deltaproteobacteria bacterium]|nr:hypothetical protein [Deltaproteobacteria bacterium]
MPTATSHFELRPDRVHKVILANRQHFSRYNIARLRELLHRLSKKEASFFYKVPLLLHVNCPDYPGYVRDPGSLYGIYRFYDSGFWALARSRLGIQLTDIHPFAPKRFHIKGLYLTGGSEFKYWVVTDVSPAPAGARDLLREKLNRIE